MAEFAEQLLNKRKIRSPSSSTSPETKKAKPYASPSKEESVQEEDDISVTALNMSQEFGAQLQEILKRLEKLDPIESSLAKIEIQLGNLEKRTHELEHFQGAAKKDINELKDGLNFTGKQVKENTDALVKAQAQIAELTRNVQKNQDKMNEIHTKNLYLEAYSRRENIKFMNVNEEMALAPDGKEDTEEILHSFLERELNFRPLGFTCFYFCFTTMRVTIH